MTKPGLAPVRTQLPNGAVIIAKESRVTPAVTIHASVTAGTAYDPPGADGVSHFVSRTIDRGTGTRTAERIADDLDSRGITLTVAANRHVMSLVCTCLTDDLDTVLELIADILMAPAFPDAEVETRRGEIITLIRQDEDSPAAMASEGLLTLLYGADHPYGRRPRGSIGSVERLGRQSLAGFHSSRVRPSGLSLVMVGDVDPARAVEQAAAALAKWDLPAEAGSHREQSWGPTSVGPEPLTFRPVQPATTRRVHVIPMMNKSQADIAYGFTSIRRDDPAYYAYWLMNNILGQYSLGGRLGDSIRERQGMAYYVFSALDANIIPGPLMVRAGVNPTNVERAVASIDAELSGLAGSGPTDQELAESKQYLIGSMPRNLETNLGIAQFLQTAEFFDLGLDYDLRLPGLLQAVRLDDVLAAARATLDPSRASVVVAGPYDGTVS